MWRITVFAVIELNTGSSGNLDDIFPSTRNPFIFWDLRIMQFDVVVERHYQLSDPFFDGFVLVTLRRRFKTLDCITRAMWNQGAPLYERYREGSNSLGAAAVIHGG